MPHGCQEVGCNNFPDRNFLMEVVRRRMGNAFVGQQLLISFQSNLTAVSELKWVDFWLVVELVENRKQETAHLCFCVYTTMGKWPPLAHRLRFFGISPPLPTFQQLLAHPKS